MITKIVWPDNPVTKNGGMYPHVITYECSWEEPGPALSDYLRAQRMPSVTNWSSLRAANETKSACLINGLSWVNTCHSSPIVWYILRKTMEITCEPKEGCPPWQCLKVAYHVCPIRLSEGKPRLVSSFTYFMQKYFGVSVTDDNLRDVYVTITGDLTMKFKDFTFHLMDGSEDGAPEVYTRVYTCVPDSCASINPSVTGSCMRRTSWNTAWGDIGINGEFPHPVTAYCVEPLALAWLENSDGETVARAIVNTSNKQIHRVYRWAPPDNDRPSSYASELEDHLVNQLAALGYTRGSEVLEGVVLRINKIHGTALCVAPYLDGDYSYLNPGTMTVDDGGYSWHHHNPPVQQCSGDIFKCCDCGEQVFPGDEHEVNGDIYCSEHVPDNRERCCDCNRLLDSDEGYSCDDGLLCESCYNRNYFTCCACGEVHHLDDERMVEDHSYCPDCFDMRFMECFHCGTVVRLGEHYLTPEGFQCCSDCFDERYAICDGCGETFKHVDLTDGRCSSCVPTELEDTNESQ
jgi:hypothetical protein